MKYKKQAIKEFINKLYKYSVGIYFLKLLTFWNFSAGLIVLVFRTLKLDVSLLISFIFAGLPICFLIGLLIGRRNLISEKKATAVIDSYNRVGGLLVSSDETGDKKWIPSIEKKLILPNLKTDIGSNVLLLTFSFMFLLLGFQVPVFAGLGNKTHIQQLGKEEGKTKLQIEVLEETGLIEEDKAEELKLAVEQIRKISDSQDPSKTFEALDHLSEKISREAGKATKEAFQSLEDLKKMKSLAEKLREAENLTSEQFNSIKKQLEKLMKDSKLGKKMAKALKSMLKNTSGKDLKKAAQELNNFANQEQKRLRQKMNRWRKARLIDKKTFERLMKEGKIKKKHGKKCPGKGCKGCSDGKQGQDGIPVFVEDENGKKKLLKPGKSVSKSGMPGKGGVGRGPGAASLTYQRPSSEHNVKFKDENMPLPTEASLEDSFFVGEGVTSPELLDAGSKESVSGNWKKSGAGPSGTGIVLPKHRSTIKNFFERKKNRN
jgi:hypothetical protein